MVCIKFCGMFLLYISWLFWLCICVLFEVIIYVGIFVILWIFVILMWWWFVVKIKVNFLLCSCFKVCFENLFNWWFGVSKVLLRFDVMILYGCLCVEVVIKFFVFWLVGWVVIFRLFSVVELNVEKEGKFFFVFFFNFYGWWCCFLWLIVLLVKKCKIWFNVWFW